MSNNTGTTQPIQNRLNLLVKLSGLTREKFADKYSLSIDTLKSYLSRRTQPPLELASKLADDYGVSLDWLYYKTDLTCHMDVVLCALSKLLKAESIAKKVRREREIFAYRERTLYIDRRLYKFLLAIQELKDIKETSLTMPEEEYHARRRKVVKDANDELKDIFNAKEFFQGNEIEIDYLELID